jgi:hypothetical protein
MMWSAHSISETRTAELGSVVGEIGLRDAACARAGAASINLDAFRFELAEELPYRRPAHRHDSIGHNLAHEDDGLAKQVDLYLVPGIGQRESV